MKIDLLRTSAVKELTGVWVDIGDGGQLLIARANNIKYLARYRELTKPYWSQIRSDTLPLEELARIHVECLAETVLLNWKGIEEGNPSVDVPYSLAKAIEFLTKIADFRQLVTSIADQQYRFREEELEIAAKN